MSKKENNKKGGKRGKRVGRRVEPTIRNAYFGRRMGKKILFNFPNKKNA